MLKYLEKLLVEKLSPCLSWFEDMDVNMSQFLKAQRMAEDTFACCQEIYEEKKKTAVPASFNRFVRKGEWPSSIHETDVEASTSHEIMLPPSSDIAVS
jgi:hypothetical protein